MTHAAAPSPRWVNGGAPKGVKSAWGHLAARTSARWFIRKDSVMNNHRSRISRLAGLGSLALALAGALAFSAPAQAQPDGRHGERHYQRDDRRDHADHRRWERERERDRRYREQQRREYRHDHRPPPRVVVVPDRGRGIGPRNDWYRGGYVPAPYRGYNYVVGDWRGHRLSAPPRGYQWIQYGGDYLLIAIGSGLIANIVINGY
jgi:Ni/Co efflux regulator RcnB